VNIDTILWNENRTYITENVEERVLHMTKEGNEWIPLQALKLRIRRTAGGIPDDPSVSSSYREYQQGK
jgi:hypothetical protein